jgi:hypothetical protein
MPPLLLNSDALLVGRKQLNDEATLAPATNRKNRMRDANSPCDVDALSHVDQMLKSNLTSRDDFISLAELV